MAKRCTALCFFTALAAGMVRTPCIASEDQLIAANFSKATQAQVFKDWQPYGFSLFGNRTRYQLSNDNGIQVMQAISEGSASGLIRKFPLNLDDYPLLSWRWKTNSLPENSDDATKSGDDHSTRLYLIFNAPESGLLGWIKSSVGWGDTHALNYMWANQLPINSQLPSPYTQRSIMIAVSSGNERVGQWVDIRRNVSQDYRRAFGAPPPPLSAIAIMTDSDNTNTRLTSYYGDIIFSRATDSSGR